MARMRRCRAAGCHKLVEMSHWYCNEHRDQEAAYLESRAKWARGHEQAYQAKYNKVTRNRNVSKAEQYAFYKSKQWQSLRQQVLDRDNHMDQYGLLLGQYQPGNTVDHIVPIEVAPELMSDPGNLITCSPATHKLKTAWEQEYYGTGIENNLTGAKIIRDAKDIPIFSTPPLT